MICIIDIPFRKSHFKQAFEMWTQIDVSDCKDWKEALTKAEICVPYDSRVQNDNFYKWLAVADNEVFQPVCQRSSVNNRIGLSRIDESIEYKILKIRAERDREKQV